mmetsp:Transcript_5625/g.20472  ORF Transcript_5625/g.20472 Transcript_5625/m.20472 type:complete len:201 (+) Transcript_5625:1783-2385(+)
MPYFLVDSRARLPSSTSFTLSLTRRFRPSEPSVGSRELIGPARRAPPAAASPSPSLTWTNFLLLGCTSFFPSSVTSVPGIWSLLVACVASGRDSAANACWPSGLTSSGGTSACFLAFPFWSSTEGTLPGLTESVCPVSRPEIVLSASETVSVPEFPSKESLRVERAFSGSPVSAGCCKWASSIAGVGSSVNCLRVSLSVP